MKHSILLQTVQASALLFLLSVSSTYAQQTQPSPDWYAPQTIRTVGKDTYSKIMKTLKKKDTVSLVFHYEQSTWRGLDIGAFSRRYARMEEEDSLAFPTLLSEWEETVSGKSGIPKGNAEPFSMHVLVKKVSKEAGIVADGLLVYEDTIPVLRMNLSVEDGRWNDFSTLFIENGEKMGKQLHSFFKDIHSFPRLYNKQYLVRK